jgi:hypothetical protein
MIDPIDCRVSGSAPIHILHDAWYPEPVITGSMALSAAPIFRRLWKAVFGFSLIIVFYSFSLTLQRALAGRRYVSAPHFLPLSNQLQSADAITEAVFIEIGSRSSL